MKLRRLENYLLNEFRLIDKNINLNDKTYKLLLEKE